MDGSPPAAPTLYQAVYNRDVGAVSALLASARGAQTDGSVASSANAVDINWRHPDGGATALYLAVEIGFTHAVQLLLDAGACPNTTRDDGASCVYKACTDGHADILKLLISAGAAVDVTDAKGLTPLYLCCLRGQVETASLLLDARADATRTHKGWSAFDLALRDGADAALQPLLLKHAYGLLLERQTTPQAAAGPAPPVKDVRGGATAPAEAATLLERLREAARRAKTVYEEVYHSSPPEELDAALRDTTAGELTVLAMAQCDWVIKMSKGAGARQSADTAAGASGASAGEASGAASSVDPSAPAVPVDEDGDEIPDWLLSAAMQLGPGEEVPEAVRSAPRPQQQQRGKSSRRTKKTGD